LLRDDRGRNAGDTGADDDGSRVVVMELPFWPCFCRRAPCARPTRCKDRTGWHWATGMPLKVMSISLAAHINTLVRNGGNLVRREQNARNDTRR
jgi:hypothetical protein